MPCNTLKDDKGEVIAIMCSRPRKKRCAYCDRQSERLCDHPVGDKGKTCDTPMCALHAWQPPGTADTDYCRTHRRKVEGPEREAKRREEMEAKKRDTLRFMRASNYGGYCREKDCGAKWEKGEPCYWDSQTREVFCVECGELMSP